jgi:hypothetical protein
MLAPTAPVPLKVTVAAVAIEAVLTVNVPAAAPVAIGANDTPTVQLAPAARAPAHVYCVQLKPWLTAIVSVGAAKAVEFVIVTVCAALVPPGVTAAKLSDAGLTFRPAAVCELPLKPTFTATTPAEDEEIFSVPALPPVVAGSKTICTMQLTPAASVPLHDVAETENTPIAEPTNCSLSPANGAPPVFVTVTDCGAPATPGACEGNVKLAGFTPSAGGRTPLPFRETV